jgi:hypothetical protein
LWVSARKVSVSLMWWHGTTRARGLLESRGRVNLVSKVWTSSCRQVACQARNRLVRMAAACVNIFFEGSLLAVDRWGSDLIVVRQPQRFPQPPSRDEDAVWPPHTR